MCVDRLAIIIPIAKTDTMSQDYEGGAGEEGPEVHLGFLDEPQNPAYLTSAYFPSKAGGKPVCVVSVALGRRKTMPAA